jgi:cytochrome b
MERDGERVMVDVWDWQTRVLHWVNALLVMTLVLLMVGKEGMEAIGIEKGLRAPVKRLHAYVGYVFVFTLTLRVVWGFIGNRFARWSDVIPLGKARLHAAWEGARWYLGGFRGKPPSVKGHDPLASIFYTALFAVLVVQASTGILLAGIAFKLPPAASYFGGYGEDALDAVEDALEGVHELGMAFMLFFIAAHLTGLVVHEVKEKKGLLSSMVHGRKYFPKDEA